MKIDPFSSTDKIFVSENCGHQCKLGILECFGHFLYDNKINIWEKHLQKRKSVIGMDYLRLEVCRNVSVLVQNFQTSFEPTYLRLRRPNFLKHNVSSLKYTPVKKGFKRNITYILRQSCRLCFLALHFQQPVANRSKTHSSPLRVDEEVYWVLGALTGFRIVLNP